MNPAIRRDTAREELQRRLHSHEVRRRVRFLVEHRMLTCSQAMLRLQASGLSAAAALSSIRAQRRLFYIQFVEVAYFPCFQWRHVCLREVIAESLEMFGPAMTKWQIALWFVEPNDLLEGFRPIDLLDRDSRAVVHAAEKERTTASAAH
jgi:hypothetical protein